MSVTYTAVLPVRGETVDFLAGLLTAERVRRGTHARTRSLSVRGQAVLVLRWFCDATRISQLARDNAISKSTAYDYLPIWTSDVRRGREHDTTAVRTHAEILPWPPPLATCVCSAASATKASPAPSPWRSRNPSTPT